MSANKSKSRANFKKEAMFDKLEGRTVSSKRNLAKEWEDRGIPFTVKSKDGIVAQSKDHTLQELIALSNDELVKLARSLGVKTQDVKYSDLPRLIIRRQKGLE